MAINPNDLPAIVDRLSNAMQVIILLAAELERSLAQPSQDAARLHLAARRATAALRELQPRRPDDIA